MLSTDLTPDTTVSGAGDPAGRRSGRRAAVSVSGESEAPRSSFAAPRVDAPSFDAPPFDAPPFDASPFDASVSPRRAARAAREAAAAAALAAPRSSADVDAPVSPVDIDAPVSPVVASIAPAVTGPTRRSTFVAAPAPESSSRRRVSVGAAPTRRPADARRPVEVVAAPASGRARTAGDTVRRVAVTTVVVGILATSVLPVLQQQGSAAYASGSDLTTAAAGAQAYDVSTGVADSVASRDGYGATSVLDYEQQVISNRLAVTHTTYTGPTAADYLAHPLFSNSPLDRAQVFQVALQYLGTPYVHGGADPSAFDCSGFIMFVYAQFGISLPHYVPSQDALGTRIPESEAVPGDVVIFDNGAHDGFYAGNGMIMDAPKPGGHISVRPIWDQPHHFVRFGN
jgi:cell wall-associated NlpC family hydrolase